MRVKLGDICKIYSGGDKPDKVYDIPSKEYNIPIYGNALDNEGLYGYTNYSVINDNSITISARGSNCGVSFYRDKPYVPIVRLLSLIPNEDIVDSKYLYYVIKNRPFKSSGSGQPQITIPQVSECEIDIVDDLLIQKRISSLLYDIDLKIKNNNKINEELEKVAKTIYDYWFLQFDFPDENGKPYKSSGGKMVWNEELKKEIPEGWEVGNINNYIAKDKGGDWGKEKEEGNYINKVTCLRGADFPAIIGNSQLVAPVRYILDKNMYKVLKDGDLIIEISGGSPTQSTGRICYINKNLIERFNTDIITSNFCKAIELKNYNYLYWFYIQWQKIYYSNVLFKYEGKTTGIKNLLFDMFISDYKIVMPPDKLITKYNDSVSAMFDQIQKNQKESQELSHLRDFLLPLLMNGQIGFKEK